MPDVSGTCSSAIVSNTVVGVPGSVDHQLSVSVVSGQHTSAGSPWDGARLTYVGTSDLAGGTGQQRGYFHNVHADGAVSEGLFEANVSALNGVITVEGTWTLTGGSGSLTGIKGGGRFKAQMTSPSASEMTWSGSYQV
jgi:hypothetical protein